MTTVLDAVLPVFALIGIGALAAWRGLLDATATDALNLFVVWLALPAVLFGACAHMSWAQIDQPGFVLAAGGGAVLTFALSMGLDRRPRRRLADRAIEGLDASYGNVGYLGLPLGLALFGPSVLPALVIAMLMTACVLFAGVIVLIEFDLAAAPADLHQEEKRGGVSSPKRPRLGATLVRTARSLARNPLVVSPILGGVWSATGLPVPLPVDRFLTLLGAAASPCALVTIGLFLVQQTESATLREVSRLVGLKLVAAPLLTFAIGRAVTMPPSWFEASVLLAALPTGTGPFMLAKLYNREAAATSRAILASTVLSVATVSALVLWIGR